MSRYFQLVHFAKLNPESSKRQGRPYYTIQVRLEADSPELMQRVLKVVYHLHPTFPNPDREISDRESSFELTTAGWGQFNLSADVYFEDNSQPLRLFRYINF
jgi:transcription initiation factor IIF auxiliary subunit